MTKKEERAKQSSTPQKPRNHTFTLKDHNQQKREINKLSTYILKTDHEKNINTVIKYHEVFGELKINEVLEEAYNSLKENEEQDLGFFTSDDQFIKYVLFLTFSRFSSLDKIIPNTLPEQIPFMLEMVDTGLFNTLHSEVFDQGEIEKVLDRLAEYHALVTQVGNALVNTQQELEKTVVNKEIFDSISFSRTAQDIQPIHPLVNPPNKDSK